MKRVFYYIEGDRAVWLVVTLLACISTLAVYSSTSQLAFRFQNGDTEYYLAKHIVLLIFGFGLMYVIHRLDYRIFGRLSYILLYSSVSLLLYTILQGEERQINSAQRWITIFGQSFQPSDLAKFSLMVYLARVLTERQAHIKDFYKSFLPAIFWVVFICGLIAPANLSTALLIFLTSLLLMFVSGVRIKYLISVISIGLVCLIILFYTVPRARTWANRLKDYTERFNDPQYQPAYQATQSYIAIANGGLFGLGPGKSIQRNYLPHPYSDFVFAIIVEEYGLLGGTFVVALYLLLLIRSVGIVTLSRTFGALLAAGLSFLIVIQALINMGVTVGLLPITGLPLPMISMGGTSILFTSVSLGVIISVSKKVLTESEIEKMANTDSTDTRSPEAFALGN